MASGIQKLGQPRDRFTRSRFVQGAEKDVKPLQAFITKFTNDWSMSFAGLLAYSLLTAMLPIAVALFGVLGLILGSNSAFTQQIADQVASVIPKTPQTSTSATSQAISLALQQLNKNAGIILLIAILLAFFGGSRLFISLEGCLDIIYRVRPRKFLNQNLMAFGMLLLFIILVPIMVFVSAAPTFILSFLSKDPTLTRIPFFSTIASSPLMAYLAAIIASLIVSFILFEAIYFVVPNQHISWRNSWLGALVAAIGLVFFLTLFPLYMRFGLSNYSGQVGFAVIILLFFYYFAVILMIGAEVNAFFREGVRPLPNDLPTFVSTMAGKLNRDIPEAEAESHADTQPTDLADKGHVAAVRQSEEQIQSENAQDQRQISTKNMAKDRAKTKKSKPAKDKSSSKAMTAVEVLAGSAIAAFIEWSRLRRGRK